MSDTKVASRRAFLAGAGGLAVGAATARGQVETSTRQPPRRRALAQGVSKGVAPAGTDGAITPPFEIRVLNRMGFGPARRVAGTVAGQDPGQIFGSGFESPSSEFLGEDDVAHFLSLGRDDDERLTNYVNEQLDPASIDDSEVDQRMAQYPASFNELGRSLASTYSRLECNGFSNYTTPQRQVEKATFLRAVYSRRQLFELIVDFWHNHFNVFAGDDEDVYVSWAHWDRQVVRANAFGNFYNMLYTSARHPVMLHYLDNYENSAGGFNENYARELFELHTMGAENYLGPVGYAEIEYLAENPYANLNDPELDALGYGDPGLLVASKYIDDDVYEAARALTGWRYNDEDTDTSCGTGAFFTDANAHDTGRKGILTGLISLLPSDNEPEQDGRIAIKLTAYHPGTATYIARKLCRRLISDNPPESIVQAAAATFFQFRKSPRQIEHTLRTILLSDEFKDAALWGQKVKRPFEYVVSAMRAAGCDHTWRHEDRTSDDFLWTFRQAGQQLFWWRTPDGYPDRRDHWEGSTSLVHCWRTIDWLLDRDANESSRVMRVINLTMENVSGNPTPRRLVEFWCRWIFGFTPAAGSWAGPPGTLYSSAPTTIGAAALQFMTQQGFSGLPDGSDRAVWPADEPIQRAELQDDNWPYDWHNRLRGLVALILWSPQFMQR